jgi:ATP-dependent RNA helicase RhlE
MTFKDLKIAEPILRAIEEKGYTQPTPIQEQSIPILLDGHDLLGCAQTGTGKTAAFAIPIIQHLHFDKDRNGRQRKIKALIVTPTRELAIQIQENFALYSKYTDLRNAVIFGGVKQGSQTAQIRQGIDILVATPGRLLDLIGQGFITLKNIEYFVLDEADQMLDMGFIHDIKKIIALLPSKRQSLFFSATMPATIVELSGKILGSPRKVSVTPEQTTAEKVEQGVYFVTKEDKPNLLAHIIQTQNADSTLVFARTKHGADKIVKRLAKDKITAEAIHGNKSQNQRQKALGNFKDGKTRVLIATDIAARGIDVSQLSLVVNYELPNVPETYIHRIGRTGRAKASGIALSFCDLEERPFLRDIEKLIKQSIPVITDHPYVDESVEVSKKQQQNAQQNNAPKKKPGSSGNKNIWRRNKPKPNNK